MSISPAGILCGHWDATPISVAALLEEMVKQIQEQADHIAALATRVAQLEEQKGCGSRNSSQPPSTVGDGSKPQARTRPKAQAASVASRRGIRGGAMTCCRQRSVPKGMATS